MAIPFLSDIATIMTSNSATFVIFELVLLFISALFIWIGAKIAQIKKGSIVRSFVIAIILTLLVPLLIVPFSAYALFSLILTIVITLAIIKIVFDTGWKKSLVAWILSIIAEIIAVVILLFVIVLLI